MNKIKILKNLNKTSRGVFACSAALFSVNVSPSLKLTQLIIISVINIIPIVIVIVQI